MKGLKKLERTEDNEGLLETYESHLQCKRSLDDRNGLIRILDALGTLHSKSEIPNVHGISRGTAETCFSG